MIFIIKCSNKAPNELKLSQRELKKLPVSWCQNLERTGNTHRGKTGDKSAKNRRKGTQKGGSSRRVRWKSNLFQYEIFWNKAGWTDNHYNSVLRQPHFLTTATSIHLFFIEIGIISVSTKLIHISSNFRCVLIVRCGHANKNPTWYAIVWWSENWLAFSNINKTEIE